MIETVVLPISGPNGRVSTNENKNTTRKKCRVTSTTPGGVYPQVPMYAYNDESENRFDSIDIDNAWRDEEILRDLYHVQELTQAEIGDLLGCKQHTVSKWMGKHGIDPRDKAERVPSGDDHWFSDGSGRTPDELTDEEWLRREHHEKKHTPREIATALDCTADTVCRWLNRHSIENITEEEILVGEDSPHYRDDLGPLRDPGELRELYWDEGLSLREIGDIAGCADVTVLVWMKKHGIERRGPRDAVGSGEAHHLWKGGRETYYGPSWPQSRKKARQRDRFECARCGMSDSEHVDEFDEELHVHHIKPFRTFDEHSKGNALNNLVTLCRECHTLLEGIPIDYRPDDLEADVDE